jgi:hypothetical protein
MTDVPAIRADHLTEPQRRAFIIADNRLALDAGWDDDALRAELSDLKLDGFALDVVGFTEKEMDSLLGNLPSMDGAPMDEAAADAYGGLTSMERTSVPMRHWREAGLLSGDVLDFGCGKERHEHARYDAFTEPDPAPLCREWDTIICNYVLNVQPAEHLIHQTCALLRALARPSGCVLVATRSDMARSYTSKRGHQVAKSWHEWAAILGRFFQVRNAEAAGFHGFICRRVA